MEPSYLLLSALPNWKGGDVRLSADVAIRTLKDGERPVVDAGDADGYWLCHEYDNPHPEELARHKKRRETAFKLMVYSTYAVQALVPCGGTGTFLLFRWSNEGWIQCGVERRQQMLPTEWGTKCAVPAQFASDAPAMLERVLEAFYKPVLRLQIPLWMMEQGLAAPDQHIRILLCATGLSSLTKASGQAVFKERLCSLLGANTLILPPDCSGRQPGYRVEEVAGHLYQLRNELAHGLPFGAIFHKKTGFLDCSGQPVAEELARHRYDKVLEECAVFLMCRAMREVLLSRLVFDVGRMEWTAVGEPGY
jgi:hypothetical protein